MDGRLHGVAVFAEAFSHGKLASPLCVKSLATKPVPSRLMVCADAASRVAVKKFVKQN
jgi:hypothetical protein